MSPDLRVAARSAPCHIAHLLPWNTVGGIEIATLRVAQATQNRGFINVFFCPSESGGAYDMIRSAGFEVISYEPVELSLRRPGPFLRASLKLSRRLREERVCLLHCSDLQGAYYGGLAGRMAGVPVVCHVRSRYAELDRRDQLLLAPVQHFVFVSKATWRRFSLAVPEKRATVIYDGLSIAPSQLSGRNSFRDEFGICLDAPVVGMVARLANVKDYYTLARAAKRMIEERPNLVVLIVGDHSSTENYRSHFDEVQSFVKQLGLADNFIFTGHRNDIHRALSAMDVFVLSTHLEGLPLVLIEAAAHALPIVATNVDGVPEIITHGETGLLAAHRDDQELAAHLSRCLDSPDFSRHLGASARSLLLHRFSDRQFADSLVAFYCRILGLPSIPSVDPPPTECHAS
jgi:glycosyltransferase involved in cell wall biosynthesis